jgi:hypothetical protein
MQTSTSISPLKTMEITETKFRQPCPDEKDLPSHTIAATCAMTMVMMPHSTNDSARPPAIAASPVALVFDMPAKAYDRPTAVGTHGTHAKAIPSRNRFLLRSSTRRFTPSLSCAQPVCGSPLPARLECTPSAILSSDSLRSAPISPPSQPPHSPSNQNSPAQPT